VVAAPLPKLPLDISIRGKIFSNSEKIIKKNSLVHWMSINGKQPIISENPDIISKSDMTIDPVSTKKYAIEIN
jgi:hypothetical protein